MVQKPDDTFRNMMLVMAMRVTVAAGINTATALAMQTLEDSAVEYGEEAKDAMDDAEAIARGVIDEALRRLERFVDAEAKRLGVSEGDFK